LKIREKNIIIGYKIGDLIAGIIALGFVIISLVAMDKSSSSFWITFIFFGATAAILLWQFINPKNKFVGKNSEEANRIRANEFKHLYNTKGLFEYDDTGFQFFNNGQLSKVKWESITQMVGFKIDLLTIDEICLHIEIQKSENLEISESTKGWFQFLKKIKEQFPSINKTWEIDIANPAFERNETVIYQKKKN